MSHQFILLFYFLHSPAVHTMPSFPSRERKLNIYFSCFPFKQTKKNLQKIQKTKKNNRGEMRLFYPFSLSMLLCSNFFLPFSKE
jgi:hypothetical protein